MVKLLLFIFFQVLPREGALGLMDLTENFPKFCTFLCAGSVNVRFCYFKKRKGCSAI